MKPMHVRCRHGGIFSIFTVLLVVGTVGIIFWALIAVTFSQDRLQEMGKLGHHQLSLINAYETARDYVLHAEQVATYAQEETLVSLGARGGFYETPTCGKITHLVSQKDYTLWNNPHKPTNLCLPTPYPAFMDQFRIEIGVFAPVINWDYEYVINGRKLHGIALQQVDVPIFRRLDDSQLGTLYDWPHFTVQLSQPLDVYDQASNVAQGAVEECTGQDDRKGCITKIGNELFPQPILFERFIDIAVVRCRNDIPCFRQEGEDWIDARYISKGQQEAFKTFLFSLDRCAFLTTQKFITCLKDLSPRGDALLIESVAENAVEPQLKDVFLIRLLPVAVHNPYSEDGRRDREPIQVRFALVVPP